MYIEFKNEKKNDKNNDKKKASLAPWILEQFFCRKMRKILMSYFGIIDARMSASDKGQPVHMNVFFLALSVFTVYIPNSYYEYPTLIVSQE